MAYTPTPPTVDPSQKGPVLSGANDVPYVGKPKPQPQRSGQPPRYGSSDGSGFDFQAYLAGKHRPRPVQVLPGQGMGPMPVGTKPLPNPYVRTGIDMLREEAMKGGLNQGGQSVAPGMGMPTQYGGPTQVRDFNVPNYGAPVQRGPMQGPPPVGTGPGSMGKPQQPGATTQMPGRQPLRPGMEYRPGGGQRPQGGQMQMPPGMHPDVWNQMDEETRMRLAGMWDGSGMQPMLPNEQGQAQMPQPQSPWGNQGGWDPRMGSGYYGAF